MDERNWSKDEIVFLGGNSPDTESAGMEAGPSSTFSDHAERPLWPCSQLQDPTDTPASWIGRELAQWPAMQGVSRPPRPLTLPTQSTVLSPIYQDYLPLPPPTREHEIWDAIKETMSLINGAVDPPLIFSAPSWQIGRTYNPDLEPGYDLQGTKRSFGPGEFLIAMRGPLEERTMDERQGHSNALECARSLVRLIPSLDVGAFSSMFSTLLGRASIRRCNMDIIPTAHSMKGESAESDGLRLTVAEVQFNITRRGMKRRVLPLFKLALSRTDVPRTSSQRVDASSHGPRQSYYRAPRPSLSQQSTSFNQAAQAQSALQGTATSHGPGQTYYRTLRPSLSVRRTAQQPSITIPPRMPMMTGPNMQSQQPSPQQQLFWQDRARQQQAQMGYASTPEQAHMIPSQILGMAGQPTMQRQQSPTTGTLPAQSQQMSLQQQFARVVAQSGASVSSFMLPAQSLATAGQSPIQQQQRMAVRTWSYDQKQQHNQQQLARMAQLLENTGELTDQQQAMLMQTNYQRGVAERSNSLPSSSMTEGTGRQRSSFDRSAEFYPLSNEVVRRVPPNLVIATNNPINLDTPGGSSSRQTLDTLVPPHTEMPSRLDDFNMMNHSEGQMASPLRRYVESLIVQSDLGQDNTEHAREAPSAGPAKANSAQIKTSRASRKKGRKIGSGTVSLRRSRPLKDSSGSGQGQPNESQQSQLSPTWHKSLAIRISRKGTLRWDLGETTLYACRNLNNWAASEICVFPLSIDTELSLTRAGDETDTAASKENPESKITIVNSASAYPTIAFAVYPKSKLEEASQTHSDTMVSGGVNRCLSRNLVTIVPGSTMLRYSLLLTKAFGALNRLVRDEKLDVAQAVSRMKEGNTEFSFHKLHETVQGLSYLGTVPVLNLGFEHRDGLGATVDETLAAHAAFLEERKRKDELASTAAADGTAPSEERQTEMDLALTDPMSTDLGQAHLGVQSRVEGDLGEAQDEVRSPAADEADSEVELMVSDDHREDHESMEEGDADEADSDVEIIESIPDTTSAAYEELLQGVQKKHSQVLFSF